MRTRRFFKITEIALLRRLAAEGKSQKFCADLLDRNPGTIAQAGKRYGIYFHATTGRPKATEAERAEQRQRRADACRRWRAKQGAKVMPQMARFPQIERFDDPRVMI